MKRFVVIVAAIALLVRVAPLALANAVAIRTLAGDTPSPAIESAAERWAKSAPIVAANAFVCGGAIPTFDAHDRVMRTDQLLFIAASRLPNECAPAGRALSFAMAAQHPSSIGYARLGTAYAANAGRCDRGYVNSLFADRMAGTTSLRDHRQRCDAAKGFFDAAELMRTADPAAALHDYTAAIAAVPTDDHCGYPWMASMAKADFEQHAGERAAARRTLAAAAAMKVGELRRDEALRRLAALDAAH